MSPLREAAQQALDLIEANFPQLPDAPAYAVMEALHKALEAEQQPLSDEQILRHITCSPLERAMFLRFARAIERAHHITGETK
jgi:hypothetical protein